MRVCERNGEHFLLGSRRNRRQGGRRDVVLCRLGPYSSLEAAADGLEGELAVLSGSILLIERTREPTSEEREALAILRDQRSGLQDRLEQVLWFLESD